MDKTGWHEPEKELSSSDRMSPEVQATEKFNRLVELLIDIQSIALNNRLPANWETSPDDTDLSEKIPGEAKLSSQGRESVTPSGINKISDDRELRILPHALSSENLVQKSVSDREHLRSSSFSLLEEHKSSPIDDIAAIDKATNSGFKQTEKAHPFIRETTPQITQSEKSDLSTLYQLINELENKLTKLEKQIYEPTELVNPLLPLIAELLKHQNEVSRDSLLLAMVPIIDRAIKQRSQEDVTAMSAALADVLPGAISQEIQNSPQKIAKAIAPEIALAMEEQIKIDRQAIANTLGPQMGEAIKNQIKVEQNAMVDALYPVIGNTISKYMVEMVKAINEKVETALSLKGIKRKIQAKIEGISEAELILQESMQFHVKAIFLIHKDSGLVMKEFQLPSESKLETEMLGGMLTAIRSFVNDCVTRSGEYSELHTIECDALKIILEVAGYCYLAAVVEGEPPKLFIEQLRQTLSKIVIEHDQAIASFNGDPKVIPDAVQRLLEKLATVSPSEKGSDLLIGITLLILMAILGWGFFQYRAHIARTVEKQTTTALDATPELSVYRIVPEVHQGKLTLTGRVPNQYLRSEAGKIASTVAPDWQIDNQIVAVKVPPDPVLTAGEVERLTWLFNQTKGVAITTDREYGKNSVNVTGIVPDLAVAEKITQAFQQIPGIEAVSNTVQIRPILETRIYFQSNSIKFVSSDVAIKIKAIQQFLDVNPRAHLTIIGHTDYRGQTNQNQELGIKRALVVKQALMALQVHPDRLHISSSPQLPPDMTAEQPLWLSRCVRFEVFIPQ
jgi:outer membrane protein OmpA-like peptidoglycan-associated protein